VTAPARCWCTPHRVDPSTRNLVHNPLWERKIGTGGIIRTNGGLIMSASENLEATKKAYAAFAAGDIEAVVSNWDDDLEWFIPGNGTLSGTYHGKDEVLGFFAKLAEKSFTTAPSRFLADEDVVVALTQTTTAGKTTAQADVLTFRDGKVIKAESIGDTAAWERIWGTK